MVVKGPVSNSNQEVALICPACRKKHRRLLVDVVHAKESHCPHCGAVFEVKA